jgi:hypothetical protein
LGEDVSVKQILPSRWPLGDKWMWRGSTIGCAMIMSAVVGDVEVSTTYLKDPSVTFRPGVKVHFRSWRVF